MTASASPASANANGHAAAIDVRRLVPPDVDAYRPLMLAAYRAHPDAFTSSEAERAALPLSWWVSRLQQAPDAGEIVLGAFEGSALCGVGGLSFEPREKARHKAGLFGMYVTPGHRSRGVGRRIVTAALEHARTRPGVRLVQLTVTEGNVGAEALYAACGFVRFGVEPFAMAVDGMFRAKVHMWCDLRCPALQ